MRFDYTLTVNSKHEDNIIFSISAFVASFIIYADDEIALVSFLLTLKFLSSWPAVMMNTKRAEIVSILKMCLKLTRAPILLCRTVIFIDVIIIK